MAEPIHMNREMVEKSKFVKKYLKQVITSIQQIDPTLKEEDIKREVAKMIMEQGYSPGVELDNNYKNEHRETTLIAVLDWLNDRKPIIAGNGTFYKNQLECKNPAWYMLDSFLKKRKGFKKELFKVTDVLSRLYQDLDRRQLNQKILANSYYGGSGAKTSSFYSKWNCAATTLSAQSVISTTENLFEAFIGDNYNFLDSNELFEWINTALHTIAEDVDFDFLQDVTKDQLVDRFYNHVIHKCDGDYEVIDTFVDHLSKDLRKFLYYKNNMQKFVEDHAEVSEKFHWIFEHIRNFEYVDPKDPDWIDQIPDSEAHPYLYEGKTAKDWNRFVNTEFFIDPNNPPESIKDTLETLNDWMMKYVYVEYMSFDRIYRLKNFDRATVTVIDTDSNILSLDTMMNYLVNKFFPGQTEVWYGRSFENNVYIGINVLTYFITNAVADILASYGKHSNIPKEYRHLYGMKNEFMFAMLVIGDKKKRYMSLVTLREGNIMPPGKTDVKGFDFKKSSCSEQAEEVYNKIIKTRILNNGDIDIRGMLKDIYDFRDHIRESIESGEKDFLPNGNAKEISGYKNPNSVQTVKAMTAWNLIHPENPIEPPSKVSLLKMTINKEDDIKDLKRTHPDIYERIVEGIFHDDTEMFVKKEWIPEGIHFVYTKSDNWWKEIPPKYQKQYKKEGQKAWNAFVTDYNGELSNDGHWKYTDNGLQVLAIPSNAKIPDWAIPYIDIKTMVNNILSPFIPVLNIFKIKTLEEGKSDRKTETPSRVVKF